MESGAAWATHRSVASDTPCARTAASTPSAIRSPSRLISRSMAKATGTSRTAMLDGQARELDQQVGGLVGALVDVLFEARRWCRARRRRWRGRRAMPSRPRSSRSRSEGRCTRAASSGSSPRRGRRALRRAGAAGRARRAARPDGSGGPCPAVRRPGSRRRVLGPLGSGRRVLGSSVRRPGVRRPASGCASARRGARRLVGAARPARFAVCRLFLISYHRSPPARWWHGPPARGASGCIARARAQCSRGVAPRVHGACRHARPGRHWCRWRTAGWAG